MKTLQLEIKEKLLNNINLDIGEHWGMECIFFFICKNQWLSIHSSTTIVLRINNDLHDLHDLGNASAASWGNAIVACRVNGSC